MTKKASEDTGTVYSTEHGRMCPACGKPLKKCACGQKQMAPKGDGSVRVTLETKGRKGSGVTVITGIPATPEELTILARTLKQKCGSGGTIKNGAIEIQGDHREMMMQELKGQGYTAKRSGG